MEQIVISLLFLYPGALVDVIGKELFRYSYCEDDTSETAHIARYFVSSAVITVASIFIYASLSNRSVATLDDIVKALTGIIEMVTYACISFIVTLVFTLIGCWMKKVIQWSINLVLRKAKGYTNVDAVDAWHELAMGDAAEELRKYAILRITTGDQTRMGFVKYWPEKLKEGIILTQCRQVEKFFDYDKAQENVDKRFIGDPWCTIYDPVSGSYIDAYDGAKLYEYLGYNK